MINGRQRVHKLERGLISVTRSLRFSLLASGMAIFLSWAETFSSTAGGAEMWLGGRLNTPLLWPNPRFRHIGRSHRQISFTYDSWQYFKWLKLSILPYCTNFKHEATSSVFFLSQLRKQQYQSMEMALNLLKWLSDTGLISIYLRSPFQRSHHYDLDRFWGSFKSPLGYFLMNAPISCPEILIKSNPA